MRKRLSRSRAWPRMRSSTRLKRGDNRKGCLPFPDTKGTEIFSRREEGLNIIAWLLGPNYCFGLAMPLNVAAGEKTQPFQLFVAPKWPRLKRGGRLDTLLAWP